MSAFRGAGLENVDYVDVLHGNAQPSREAHWTLQGVTSSVRYATGTEVAALKAHQPALDRLEATCAALIPIKESASW